MEWLMGFSIVKTLVSWGKDIVWVSDLRARLEESQAENAKLKEALQRLETQDRADDRIFFKGNVYWRRQDGGAGEEGPFCPRCYGEKGKTLNLGSTNGWHNCAVCGWSTPTSPASAVVNPQPRRRVYSSWMQY